MGRVIFYEKELDTLLKSPRGAVGRHLKGIGRKIVAAAKAQVGVRTGALRSSIHMRHFRDPRGQYIKIGSSVAHAYMHHEGTRPHLILPKKRAVLRFMSKGQIINTLLVRHPGTRPNRYLSDNLKLVR
jgi:hypothetical protein